MPLSNQIYTLLHDGTVIPAHPLALHADRSLDEQGQRLLTKYYLAAGVGGIAVGVHTTQFEIREPSIGLFEPVLTLAMEEVETAGRMQDLIKVAGVSGLTAKAVQEAELAKKLGYDLALVSTNGLSALSENDLIERAKAIGEVMPLFGFYLQPAVGGKVLSEEYWAAFCEIEQVFGIKMAPFNRYQTLDVIHAVCNSSRNKEIALYTGNDDTILVDLLTTFHINTAQGIIKKDIVGGLLGHWAVWTKKAVELLEEVKALKKLGSDLPSSILSRAAKITDSNAAFFDAKNNFRGCIAGIHEVLYRQGLMRGVWCLSEHEKLSAGQSEEIDRVYRDYPELNDDAFVKDFLKINSL
ncbi:MAG: dihydrodipicolinate synthase family protein [Saprospiraceae bacterium]|nr:dihydrodipicolinate synthase family protein [Saprospiraceae bacterium]